MQLEQCEPLWSEVEATVAALAKLLATAELPLACVIHEQVSRSERHYEDFERRFGVTVERRRTGWPLGVPGFIVLSDPGKLCDVLLAVGEQGLSSLYLVSPERLSELTDALRANDREAIDRVVESDPAHLMFGRYDDAAVAENHDLVLLHVGPACDARIVALVDGLRTGGG